MKMFWRYLKQRRQVIGMFCLFAGIDVAVQALYRLPIAAAVYPLGLCAVIGLCGLLVDFGRVFHRHRQMNGIRSAADVLTLPLPEAQGILEQDYQRLLRLLCREQKRQSDDMSRKYREMTDYYTVWAHQIKTPIAAMKLNLQNEDTPLSRQLSSDLMRVEQYVDMALMFLRLDSDSMDYVIQPRDLDGIVRQAVRKFAGEFIARRLKLVYEPVQAQVVTDGKWLSFVVEQVLSNALKYTPQGSIRIYLEDGALCVRDTGIGIAPEDLPRIFEKGYTGCNGRRDQRASGIGLYLCRQICRRLGHAISAESVPDEGTTIRIDLNQRKLEAE